MKQTHDTRDHAKRDAAEPKRADTAMKRIERAVAIVRMRREELYDRYADRVHTLYSEGKEKTLEGMDEAMRTAREQMQSAGSFTMKQGERFESFLRRDMQLAALELKELGNEAIERLDPARVSAGVLASLGAVLRHAGDTLKRLAASANDALTYRTGEVTSAGTLTCLGCGKQLRFKSTGTVPPCPKCRKTEYRKGY